MLKSIEIKNVKSIKYVFLDVKSLTTLIGSNGTGKSTLIEVINYFYDCLDGKVNINLIQDRINPYLQNIEISMYYDVSLLEKILKRQIRRFESSFSTMNYFNKILKMIRNFVDDNKILKVTLIQDREGNVKFNIPTYEYRKIIKNIFPLYIIDARRIDLNDWNLVWNTIADLGKVDNIKDSLIKNSIKDSISNKGNKAENIILETIDELFEKNDIEIVKESKNANFINLYQYLNDGKKFKYKKQNLDFYSDGLNSFNFIRMVFGLINLITKNKLKFPIIILDEPEIGLHPTYIDELSEIFKESNNRLRILISTHSSRIVKNLLSSDMDMEVYHLRLVNNYTSINKMKYSLTSTTKPLISEQEASYFFADAIVFLEGDSEMELFSNEKVLLFFPKLKSVSFYSTDSNTNKLSIIHPKDKEIGIPYLTIVDSDMIYTYNESKKTFALKKDKPRMNPLCDKDQQKKEIFYYGKLRGDTYNRRLRINKMIKKVKFYFDPYWGTIKGNPKYFDEFRRLTKKYCLEYNVYPVLTTIEGCLININNLDIYIDWLKEQNKGKIEEIDILFSKFEDSRIKVTIARLIQKGKLDNLKTRKDQRNLIKSKKRVDETELIISIFSDEEKIASINSIITQNKESETNLKESMRDFTINIKESINSNFNKEMEIEKILNLIDELGSKKTHWITSFLNYYFESLDNSLTTNDIRSKFKKDFPELAHLIKYIERLL